MCKLAIVQNRGNAAASKRALRLQFEKLSQEKDGAGALSIHKDGTVHTCRELKDYAKVFDWALSEVGKSKLVSIHTRTGTSGGKNEHNVHFFQDGGRHFAHNGFVMKYHTSAYDYSYGFSPIWGNRYGEQSDEVETISYDTAIGRMIACKGCQTAKKGYCKKHAKEFMVSEQTEDGIAPSIEFESEAKPKKEDVKDCDSLQFLKSLPKVLTPDILAAEVKAKSFMGASLIVEQGKQSYFLCYKECYLFKDNGMQLITTYEPELKEDPTEAKKAGGITYIPKAAKITGTLYKIVEGVHKIQ